jgi:AcrR family transcriptional regulator
VKNEILQKAIKMFLDLGFKSVTMDDLAKELAISKKTIYSIYSNKTELVEDCTLHLSEAIYGAVKELSEEQRHPIDELFGMRSIVKRFLKNEKNAPQYQLQKYFPRLFKKLKERQLLIMRDFLMRNLERGVREGVYRNDLNPELVFRLHFFTYFTLKDQELFPEKLIEPHTAILEHLKYHIRGIATLAGQQFLEDYLKEHQIS